MEATEEVEISGGGWRRSKPLEAVEGSGGRRVWRTSKGPDEVEESRGGQRLCVTECHMYISERSAKLAALHPGLLRSTAASAATR
jgi:hypothetical protein